MSEVPKRKKKINWSDVITCAESHMEDIFKRKGTNEDDEHYIFEAVISAMYGKDIWDEYNQQMK